MAPMLSEPPRPRPRRQAFVATCSPDELLGQVIQALCPSYNIDAPHLLALRQVLSSAIVAPKKPPTLKRTRPDRRIGEVFPVHDTPRRSVFGPNGPPVSAEQSFYFHHQDPDFERLLPQVDRTRFDKPEKPNVCSNLNTEEVLDSQESMESVLTVPLVATPDTQCSVSTEPTTLHEPTLIDRKETSTEHTHQPRISSESESPVSDNSKVIPTMSQDGATHTLTNPHTPPIPAITITSPQPTFKGALSLSRDIPVPSALPIEITVAMQPPLLQDSHEDPQSSTPVCHIVQYTDTQDTVISTQQSEVFSQPVDFVHFTPPTQEDSQSGVMSSQPTPSAISLGKRPRSVTDTMDREPELKRARSGVQASHGT
ncbi:hypothetical protein C7974DRAFT_44534 [Boeremia exigua]|uniref:uncharacterized protein n=1 Tax=Boeremia exigua TaxID=749465 RepID=UPI001E8DAAE8|nr:uncharacterized protein C7974DRAFT_44534 [Boeremia exigua]KAH6616431.1 hypothetical protein C7974DRAFT_44534 [Boeremia exigua]